MKDVINTFNQRSGRKIRKLLKLTNAHVKADSKIDKLLDFFHVCQDHSIDASWTLDYYNVLNTVYFMFTGRFEKEVYAMFDSPNDTLKKPIAWYGEVGWPEGLKELTGPDGRTGFICDNINDVILEIGDENKNLKSRDKYILLESMFGDLIELLENTPPPIPEECL